MTKKTLSSRQIYVLLAALMVVITIVGTSQAVFMPSNQGGTPVPGTPAPPTFPPPGTPQVDHVGVYHHPSGIFEIVRFAGWEDPNSISQGTVASVSFTNNAMLAVIHAYVVIYENRVSRDTVIDYIRDNEAGAWSYYSSYQEISHDFQSRPMVSDYELELSGLNYLARQLVDYQDNMISVLRLVVPGNNPGLLDALESETVPTFVLHPDAAQAPVEWEAHRDEERGFTLKLPPGWEVEEPEENGEPVRLYDPDELAEATITIESDPDGAPDDEDEAREYVLEMIPDASIISVRGAEREGGVGFAVSFSYPATEDGTVPTGAALLLRGNDGFYAMFLRLPPDDPLDETVQQVRDEALTMVRTFTPLGVFETGEEAAPDEDE